MDGIEIKEYHAEQEGRAKRLSAVLIPEKEAVVGCMHGGRYRRVFRSGDLDHPLARPVRVKCSAWPNEQNPFTIFTSVCVRSRSLYNNE